MKRIEEAAFSRGVPAAGLMEEAGRGIARIVRDFHPVPGRCVVFAGKGHNAGDAFVAARHLAAWGWRIDLRLAFPPPELAPLAAEMLARVPDTSGTEPASSALVAIDGLLGIGARGEPRGAVAEAIAALNGLREQEGAWTLAIDLPSGLDGDSGVPAAVCVRADLTAAIACAKSGLVADSAVNAVGRLAVVPLDALPAPESRWRVTLPQEVRHWLPVRAFDTHKGMCGRLGIVAGSPGFFGAARMCSAAAVHAGGGLVTVYALPESAPLLAALCLPEVMVKTVSSYREALRDSLDVLAIGPGLGRDHDADVLALIRDARQPVIVDADALNALSQDPALLGVCAGPRLLTPHPGEMQRLFPQNARTRREWLEDFLERYPATLLLKGARTLIGRRGGDRFYNTTGNPGMASGGMGDVLTGVCTALAAQVCGPDDDHLLHAAVLGAWLCGRAAEHEVFGSSGSPESLSATAVIGNLGPAFRALRSSWI
ncbi:MAG TPA: NAD(P)H-hydrate dehydratase [Terrimicrobiaceae bacterium]|nr:NAD(P)H-hydrate dehydratase [Terrimicrobiaceae bacterium]